VNKRKCKQTFHFGDCKVTVAAGSRLLTNAVVPVLCVFGPAVC